MIGLVNSSVQSYFQCDEKKATNRTTTHKIGFISSVSKSKRRSQSVMRVSLVLLLAFVLVVPSEEFYIFEEFIFNPLRRVGQPGSGSEMARGQGPYKGPAQGANTPAPRDKGSFHLNSHGLFAITVANTIRAALF
ncbi:unnamed protein product [Caenorhabditis auriculariae]|uniref:Uncharacterized protein n=1 Tax=Caenorhabditis auriculariae TaxID=2777116 RepID=A0A8S1HYN0_9PELO|nr:unnamed protein product [Caenorhabditis auriculariae]